ncbi:hypothetical protein [Rhizobium halophilum]|nr:hypothetical protein [Rhizobium halophilum]
MSKMDWLLLAGLIIPVVPGVMRELRLWREARRKEAASRSRDKCR